MCANILVHNNEVTISNKGVIMKSIVLHFLGKDIPRPSGLASTLSPLPEAPHTFPEILYDDDEDDEEPATTHKRTKEPTSVEESTKFVHLDSDKEDDDRQHTFTPTTTTKNHNPRHQ
ncbi:hypothetical protein PVK06_011999 [Gossypium arboreum]|uniref:Uncharacterized protein n=1 Tax=Gossypium arboreum TaxID=29729 RepID=A0ABR0QA72_GOSAR|nr:hypothetical protein PVK06_011999 [Gossypium arboreum]